MSRKVFPQHNEIKKLREVNGWSQEWVAQAADISKRTYQRIEAGEGCSIETLKSIASVYEVNFKILLPAPALPKVDTSEAIESFQASWGRLALLLLRNLLIRPLRVTIISVSLVVTAVGLGYGLHKAELVYIDVFVPMSDAEKIASEERFARFRAENPNNTAFPKGVPVRTEAEEYRLVLLSIVILALFPWMFAMMWYFNAALYSRDWHHLVEIPAKAKCTAWGQAMVRKFAGFWPSA
ncbi:MAG: helix-turn-helix transcriptional regulator [Gammaproteobacteria bacterium]|nr:helix-turn-helix transcriptional regulator [Gammaproteobacteria bacterium]